MDSLDLQVLNTACAWAEQGWRFALITVARTRGSAPRMPGAWLALRTDGVVVGSVSGGCVEDDLIDRIKHGRLTGDKPCILTYGTTAAEAQRFRLPCGGVLELVVEPMPDTVALETLRQRLMAGWISARQVDIATGAVSLRPALISERNHWNGGTLTTVHGPRWRLLLIGAGQLSRCLAEMALALDYQITVCDPRQEYSQAWDLPGVERLTLMPDDAVAAFEPDARSAVVALTHDPKLDDLALIAALKSPAFYVGALGSRANTARRQERLRQFDLSAEDLIRLHGPVGLYIGSRTPPEIAISILAELIAVRNGVAIPGQRPEPVTPAISIRKVAAASRR
ncbi:MAG: XdhC family protein [Candidatus Competibacteraceae bacterium]